MCFVLWLCKRHLPNCMMTTFIELSYHTFAKKMEGSRWFERNLLLLTQKLHIKCVRACVCVCARARVCACAKSEFKSWLILACNAIAHAMRQSEPSPSSGNYAVLKVWKKIKYYTSLTSQTSPSANPLDYIDIGQISSSSCYPVGF